MAVRQLDSKLVVNRSVTSHFGHKVTEAYDHNRDLIDPMDIGHSLVLEDLMAVGHNHDLQHLDRLSKAESTSMTSVSVALQFVSILAQATCYNKRLLVTLSEVAALPGSLILEHRHQSHSGSPVSIPWEVLAYLQALAIP